MLAQPQASEATLSHISKYDGWPHILCVGFNHHASSIETLETLHRNFERLCRRDVAGIRNELFWARSQDVSEFVVISTCNRFEVCLVTKDIRGVLQVLASCLVSLLANGRPRGAPKEEGYRNLVVLADREAIEHIFSVSCGLDSMVVGEKQILSQMKHAAATAIKLGAASKLLSQLFRRAVKAGDIFRSRDLIPQSNQLSVGWLATEFLRERIASLAEPKVLLIGAGKMVVEALLSLQNDRVGGGKEISITIANRTLTKANALALQSAHTTAIPLEQIPSWLGTVDVVICATASDSYVLTAEDIKEAVTRRVFQGKPPLLVLDIGMPRNVEPSARNVAGASLWNVDDLKPFVKRWQNSMEQTLPAAKRMVAGESEDYIRWFNVETKVSPTIAALRRRGEAMRKEEVEKSFRRLSNLTAKEKEVIDVLSKRIVNRMFSQPTDKLRELASNGHGEAYSKIMSELFSLEESE
jgi:glutamyl-tRNA reductase